MKVFFTNPTSYRPTGSSVNPSISGATLSENGPWVPVIPSCMTLHYDTNIILCDV